MHNETLEVLSGMKEYVEEAQEQLRMLHESIEWNIKKIKEVIGDETGED